MSFKRKLLDHLTLALEAAYQTALVEAKRAHSTSTDKANIAENKYDTLAIEAAYLAEGQARRSTQCLVDLKTARNIPAVDYSHNDKIEVGALIQLVDQHEKSLLLFLASASGGLKFVVEQETIMVITPSSPLGKHLLGKHVEDEFEFGSTPHQKTYYIQGIR